MLAMTKEDIQARIDAKTAELKQLEESHNQLVQNFNAQAAANQTAGCKIQGAIDELTALKANSPDATTSTTDSPPA